MLKRGQTAMEYLMTYGWAILIVLIALVALFYLGVFNPSTPNICTVGAPLNCNDVKLGMYVFQIDINIPLNVNFASISSGPIEGCTGFSPVGNIDTSNNYGGTYSLYFYGACINPLGLELGDKFSGDFDIEYSLTSSEIIHKTTVKFSGTIE
ncbi:hypothetical protein K8R47_03460 [archaeon]|nr:hypothetical protein [archaeon]